MLPTFDLVLDLVDAICYLLLYSLLIHLAFQCMGGFRQLLNINTKLLSKSTVIFICKAPLRFQLTNLGQQLRPSLLCLLPKCKNLPLESHQTLLSFNVSTSSSHTLRVVLGGLHKDAVSSWGKLP